VSVQVGFHIVGEAETGTEARELIESLERAREAHYVRCLTRDASERDESAVSLWPAQMVVRSVGRDDLVPVVDVHWIEAAHLLLPWLTFDPIGIGSLAEITLPMAAT